MVLQLNFINVKIDFQLKIKERRWILYNDKGSTSQVNRTLINMYMLNRGTSSIWSELSIDLRADSDNYPILLEAFNPLLQGTETTVLEYELDNMIIRHLQLVPFAKHKNTLSK